ncbi:MAG: endonuclease III domain-containing protein [Candidatus Omnitrophica bacterium]|nr:endonuclease III domain-containing protein [Candidatus Omnitrophota bacterium]
MKLGLNTLYRRLFVYFGPQHWWPGDSAFEVMVGAILTQNTSWANVEKAIANLKRNRLLEPAKLYQIPQKRLAGLIRPAGYYNIKAKRLRNFLRFLLEDYKGNLSSMSAADTPALRQALLAVNGIGPETADSILLYALDKPVFVVDAYTRRIFFRHRLIKEGAAYQEIQDLFMKNLKKDVELFNEYHALLVKLGKDFCLKTKPRCEICPIK